MKFFVALFPLIFMLLLQLGFHFLVLTGHVSVSKAVVVCSELILSTLACYCSYYLFRQLVAPLKLAKTALDEYELLRQLPALPVVFDDEAGALLESIQHTISKMDKLITGKTDMIDLLSHDLRSPVGRIISLAELIRIDPEDNKELYCKYIEKECNGLLRMLENILVMLKDDSGESTFEQVNLKKVVQETVDFFDFRIAEKKLDVRIGIDGAIMVDVQQDLFVQSLRNIISNAVKFSPDGKSIVIDARVEPDRLFLAVIDEGMGFKQSEVQHLFDRFSSAGKKGAKGEASTGLGLYLSKKIIERHGGQLIAQSAGINKGAAFTIALTRFTVKSK